MAMAQQICAYGPWCILQAAKKKAKTHKQLKTNIQF